MSEMQLLRLFISERLSVAAEEIFSAVQRTISEQRSHQDGDHRHGLKPEVQSLNRETPHGFISAYGQTHHETDWSPKSCHNDPSVKQDECGLLVADPPAIKQEEPWSSPEGEQLPDMEDTSTLKVTPTFIYSAMTELQTHDTGNEDRKPVLKTSADRREIEGNAQSSSECWNNLPDRSVTVNNMGPKQGLATVTEYSIGNIHTQSPTGKKQWTKICEPNSSTSSKKDTNTSQSYCCSFCGKEFRRSAHLATHTQIHTGETMYVCELCGKEFRHGNSLTAHMRIHSEDRPHRCRICGKEFRHVGNLNVHTRIHTGEKPYTCTVCGKKFSRNNVMTKHMEDVHLA